MTKRERIEKTFRLEKPDRVPFVPAIYEHKGALIGKSPSEICRNAGYLYSGLKQELAAYDPDMLVIGIDVYNVEAEAIGCRVVYFEGTNDCPAIADPLMDSPSNLGRMRNPDPESDGRMPLYLEVAGALNRELGPEMIVRGALTGPFSMASALLGAEKLLITAIEEPRFAEQLLFFCSQVAIGFGKAFLARGVQPIIFDSRATPRLASPRIFRELVKPLYRDLIFPQLKNAGGRFMPLIIGGDTTLIIDDLIETGAGQLLCDPPSNLDQYKQKCAATGIPFRANVDARLVNSGPEAAILKRSQELLERCADYPGLILGCGVVSYDCPEANVLAIRRAIESFADES